MKYFLLGAFSSAFFLFGIALLYGYAGLGATSPRSARRGHRRHRPATTLLLHRHRDARRRPAVQDRRRAVPRLEARRLPGRADPGHRAHGRPARWWRPSARCCGSSTWRCGSLRWDWRPVMWGVAILTMVVGAILAITQTDIKRLLAYSSIAHAGFILTGVIATSAGQGCRAVLFYLVAYGFTTVGAFAVVTLVRDAGGEAGHLSRWAGPRQALAAGGRDLRAVPAGLRRYPADQRLHREVRRLPGGDRRRRDAAGDRRRA